MSWHASKLAGLIRSGPTPLPAYNPSHTYVYNFLGYLNSITCHQTPMHQFGLIYANYNENFLQECKTTAQSPKLPTSKLLPHIQLQNDKNALGHTQMVFSSPLRVSSFMYIMEKNFNSLLVAKTLKLRALLSLYNFLAFFFFPKCLHEPVICGNM